MDNLYYLVNYAYDNNMKRTIVNFRFSINDNIYKKLFKNFRKDIINNDEYHKIKLNNIQNITEVRCCYKNKNIINLSLINPKIYNNIIKNNNRNKKKCININIIKENENTNNLKYYLENCNTSFDSFIKKKKEKKKTLIKLFNNDNNTYNISNDTNYTRYYQIQSEYNNITSEVTIRYKIILEIFNEKIITEGRLLLPNSISITVSNRSRIILYDNNKIQIILSKNKSEYNIEDFGKICSEILEIFFKITKEYTKITINDTFINSLSIHCDFNYINYILKYPIFFEDKKIRFFGKNKISIKSITSKDKLEKIYMYIKKNIYKMQKLYDEIDNCDPVSDSIDSINTLVNKIYFDKE
ncbi:VITF-3 45kda subunit (Cop-A23R) [Choristoneura biennis entomopoxvirus]|uniref:Intermediate transcription factor 3 large subunit n=1 Tax=Choristoneura biennis entomopoxvirus TaxID=10288 RepID=A0A916KPL8_CBEPV|nr:VITF-3 45kda subunit (Cop-A23R) [Choristoneura biennis entomopoxvirus]CCU55716.1 VITF-3 45kda subunit (Cop-A23R) [Choristoneura biennis entomopoxvirus]